MPIDARGMLRCVVAICASIATLGLLPVISSATTVRPMTFDELVAEAVTIVRGEVTDVRSVWRDRDRESPIVTLVTVRVDRALKGRPAPELLLEFLGGTVDDRTLAVGEMPQFTVGDRQILFINDATRQASPLVGFFIGRFPIRVDAFTGREFVTTFDGRPLTDPADIGIAPSRSLSNMRAAASSAPLSVGQLEILIQRRVQP